MNCKQGDLAIVIKSRFGFEGVIVSCLKFVGTAKASGEVYDDLWRIMFRGSEKHPITGRDLLARDFDLRPLSRDIESEDVEERAEA